MKKLLVLSLALLSSLSFAEIEIAAKAVKLSKKEITITVSSCTTAPSTTQNTFISVYSDQLMIGGGDPLCDDGKWVDVDLTYKVSSLKKEEKENYKKLLEKVAIFEY